MYEPLRLADFDYDLPPELIAQTPADRRDASRLLVLPRGGAPPRHHAFADLPELLPPGALVVVNDARVVPARLFARKPSGGKVEVLLVDQRAFSAGREVWTCRIRGGKSIGPGALLELLPARGRPPAGPPPRLVFLGRAGEEFEVAIEAEGEGGVLAALDAWGEVPLPPYISRPAGP